MQRMDGQARTRVGTLPTAVPAGPFRGGPVMTETDLAAQEGRVYESMEGLWRQIAGLR
jgi:hypothetical protein